MGHTRWMMEERSVVARVQGRDGLIIRRLRFFLLDAPFAFLFYEKRVTRVLYYNWVWILDGPNC